VAKSLTPEQKFKRLHDLANSYDPEKGPAKENEAAERKWREWLKRHDKKPIDISSILAQAERDDDDANPPAGPPPDPRDSGDGGHIFDDPKHNPPPGSSGSRASIWS
jgi:hypothetical protein